MDNTIIGRNIEKEILRQRIESGNPELIAFYGRRRVGKTFLVRQYFKNTFSFYLIGIYQGSKKEQLGEFRRQLEHYSGNKWKQAKDWFDAAGRLIYTGRESVLFLPHGVYMVVIGNEVEKVVI